MLKWCREGLFILRKIVFLIMAVALSFSLAACGGVSQAEYDKVVSERDALQSQLQAKEDSESASESSSDSPAIISDKTDDPDKKDDVIEAKTITIGETITFDWAEFTLDSIEWVNDVLPSNTVKSYTYYKGIDGEIHLVIRGTWKNTSGESYDIGDIESQFIINDKYKYIGSATREDDDGGGFSPFSLDPLKKVNFIIYTSVPDEAKKKFEICKLTFGFDDNMKNTALSKLSELDNVYEIEIK